MRKNGFLPVAILLFVFTLLSCNKSNDPFRPMTVFEGYPVYVQCSHDPHNPFRIEKTWSTDPLYGVPTQSDCSYELNFAPRLVSSGRVEDAEFNNYGIATIYKIQNNSSSERELVCRSRYVYNDDCVRFFDNDLNSRGEGTSDTHPLFQEEEPYSLIDGTFYLGNYQFKDIRRP